MTVQAIKDIFSLSIKTLDQIRRNGAFQHLIRRKTAAQDSGLYTLKVNSKIICLPLSDDLVRNWKRNLKKGKNKKDSLKDLIPEWTNQKWKFSENTENSWNNFEKAQTVSYDKQ